MVSSATSRRIVIVDREAALRRRLMCRLLRDGHHVCSVAGLFSAYKAAVRQTFDTAIVGAPADVARGAAARMLRELVTLVIRLSDERLAQPDDRDVVVPRDVDLDVLCSIVRGGPVAAAAVIAGRDRVDVALCDGEIRPGMRCERERGHDGLHRWTGSGRTFVWG
jgi:hypothetical protein